MPSLLDRLHELRRRVRRLLWLSGLSWATAGLIGGVLLLGLSDWLWHFDERALRMGLLAALLVAVGVIAWRQLVRPLRRPLSNLELSSHLEHHFPKLRSRLATAVEFLEHDLSPQIGSPELQRRLIEQTAEEVRSLDLAEVLDRRESQRAALAMGGLFGVGVLLFAVNSAAAATAVGRLLWPLNDRPWPKSVELQLVREDLSPIVLAADRPLRALQGEPLDLFVINARGALPQPVLIEFRRPGRMPQSEPLRVATLRGSSNPPREAAAVRLPADEGRIEFRAIGGDDRDMPWRELQIIPAPRLKSFRIEVTPPSYTGDSTIKLPEGAVQVRTLVGSKVHIQGRANRPIHRAAAGSDAVQLAKNGLDVGWQFDVRQPGSATRSLALADRDGFQNASALRLEVVGVVDPPPIVTLEQPATDLLVTAQATVRFAATARDDRKLRDVKLEHHVVGTLPLKERSDEGATSDDAWHVENVPHEGGREAVVKLAWPLSQLALKVGDRVSLRVIATDDCDVGEPRVGRSVIRTLTVVSADDKRAEIAHRLDLLLHDLESLAAKQSQSKEQAEALRVQAEKANEFRPQDRDSLKRVELDQRQIGSRLTGRDDGVLARTRELLSQLEDNLLDDSVTRERLTQIAAAIERLSREPLPALESLLGRVVKESAGAGPLTELTEPLREITTRQADVLATLKDLIRDLAQWHDRRELAREIAELASTQESLNRDTTELAPQTLGKSASQLPNQQQADLAKLADRQSRQAERIEQLRQRLDVVSKRGQTLSDSGETKGSDPVLKPPLETGNDDGTHGELANELDQRALAAKAREAAREVTENNLGQAGRTQQELTDDLQALAAKLRQSAASGRHDTVRELQQLEQQVESLVQQQRRLLDQTRDAAAQAESRTSEQRAEQAKSLREQQAEGTKSAEDLLSKLKETRADESRDALRRAGRHMRQAESHLGDQQLTRGADEEQAALEDLEQSQRELAATRRAAQQQQQAEQANALAESVRELIARQQTVIDETGRLADEQRKAGKWTRPLSKAALNLGEAEQQLADGTEELSKSLTDIEAVRLTLDRAARDLSAAASRLREKQLDEETARREQSALLALKSLAEALAPPPSKESSATAESTPPEPEKTESSDEPVPPVAQLKLLRQLQVEIGEQTRAADARLPKSPPTPDESQRRKAELRPLEESQQSVREATSRLLDRVPVTDSAVADSNDETPSAESAPRQSVLSAMQQSFDQLQAAETGASTQTAQQTAVESFDTLLKQWQQRASQRSSMARSGQPAPKSDKSPDPNSSNSDGSGGKPTGRDSAQARNSSDREQTGSDAAADLHRQRQLREAVWGHLPPALREKMLNLPHDKSLPKYTEHIRRYYESLAEQE